MEQLIAELHRYDPEMEVICDGCPPAVFVMQSLDGADLLVLDREDKPDPEPTVHFQLSLFVEPKGEG